MGIDGVQIAAGGDHVDVVGLNGYGFGNLLHRHSEVGLQQLVQMALMFRSQVHHNDEGQSGIFRHMLEKCFKGRQSSGRSANAYDGECISVIGRRRQGKVVIHG